MTKELNIKNNRELQHEKLIKQTQNALANLMATLNESQYKLLVKYIKCNDRLNRHEFIDTIILFRQNKKDRH